MPAILPNPSDEKKTEKKTVTKKKSVDKWKKKSWYTIFAPKEFDRKEIGTTVSEKPQSLIGRKLQINARNLSGDVKKSHITLIFRIVEVKGNKAYADVSGHEIKDSYLRKFVRRRNSKIEIVKFVETKDKFKVKVKAIVLTAMKTERRKKTAVRKVMIEKIEAFSKTLDSQPFISELVFGNIPQKIFNEAKKIAVTKRVEITKSRVLAKK